MASQIAAEEVGSLRRGARVGPLAAAGAVVAAVGALAGASFLAARWPWLPPAALFGVLLTLWCIQRPSRWIYLLTATIFLESSNLSLYVAGARVRPAQILLLLALPSVVLSVAGDIVRLRRVPMLAPLVFYLACNFVSALFGPALHQCFKIFLLLTSLVALYAVTYVLVRDDPGTRPSLFRFFVIVGLVEILYGLYQVGAGAANVRLGLSLPIGHLGIVHTEYLGTFFGRPYGSLPEPDVYGAVCLFYGLLLGLMWLSGSDRFGLGKLLFLGAAAAMAGLLIGMVRASWFGFLVGLGWAFHLRLIGRFPRIRALRFAGAFGLIALVVAGSLASSPRLREILARRFATGSKAAETSLSTHNVRFRQLAFSYKLFLRRPLIGNGPGSFSILGTIGAHEEHYISIGADLSRIYDPCLVTTVLNDTGLLGAAAFLAVVASYFGHVRRRLRLLADGAARNTALAAHCALIGLFASFIFTHYFWLPFTWLFIAMTVLLFEPGAGENQRPRPRPA